MLETLTIKDKNLFFGSCFPLPCNFFQVVKLFSAFGESFSFSMLHHSLTPVCMVIRSISQIRLSGIFDQPKQNRFQLLTRIFEAIFKGITQPETAQNFKGYWAYFLVLWLVCVHVVGSGFASLCCVNSSFVVYKCCVKQHMKQTCFSQKFKNFSIFF